VVGDKLIKLKNDAGDDITLEEDLKALAQALGVPFREIELR
jgi:hypothetical protein